MSTKQNIFKEKKNNTTKIDVKTVNVKKVHLKTDIIGYYTTKQLCFK